MGDFIFVEDWNFPLKMEISSIFRLQGDQTSQSQRKSILNIHWKDWCWSWSSNTLATWCEETLIRKDSDAGKRLKAGGVRNNRGWDNCMAPPTQWTWVWAHSGNGEGQGSWVCCSTWGCKELDMTEQLNNNKPSKMLNFKTQVFCFCVSFVLP